MSFSVEIVESPSLSFSLETGFTDWSQIANKPDLLTTAVAASTYLTQTSAASTYVSSVSFSSTLASYLTAATAASTYVSQSSAAATYAAKATTLAGYGITDAITAAVAASTYLTQSSAASTYAPLANPVFNSSLTLPNWTTAGRPASPTVGMIGWNSTLSRFDHYTGASGWKNFVRLDGDTMTGPLAIIGGTVTASTPLLNVTQTWNGTGVTFTGLLLNVTDNLSAAASLLLDLQVGGSSKFSVSKSGAITTTGQTFVGNNPVFTVSGTLLFSQDFSLGARAGGLFVVNSSGAYSWSGSTAYNVTPDTYLYRDAAGIVAQRNGSSAQGFRVYNTYTDASNYERAVFDWITSANTLTIGTQNAGTGVARALSLVSAASSASVYVGGSLSAYFFTNQFRIPNLLGFSDTGMSANDTFLQRDGASGVIAQRNGVNAQSFRIYNTYTDSLNYERGNLDWTKYANNLTLSTQAAGTGTARGLILEAANGQIAFFTSGASWQVLAGVLRVAGDNTGAIGGLNTNRPQTVYSYGGLKATGTASSIEAWNTDSAVSTVNYEKGVFDWITNANILTIGSVASGTGTARSTLYSSASSATLQSRTNGVAIDSASGLTLFQKAGVSVWQITTTGTFGTQTDGGQDIGNSGGQRPNNVHMLGTLNLYNSSPTINTPNGALKLTAATAGKASLSIPAGTAPTTPNNGDIWFDGTNIKIQVGGITKTFTIV